LESEDVADGERPEVVTASVVFGAEKEDDLILTLSIKSLVVVGNSRRYLESNI
jgi:hypothetical protein